MLRQKILLLAIFAIACLFRFQNLNWDSNQHLHPDERFLTMVGNSMKMPASFHDYLNPEVSTFNPVNVGHTFYVYGVFPVVVNKLIAIQLGNDDYNAFTLQGRALSAVCDMAILLLVYKIAQLLFHKEKDKNTIAILAAFFYAIAVLPIQLSHFFTTDMFLSLGMISSFYFSLRFYYHRELGEVVLSAVALGLAISSKVNAILILPLVLLLLAWPYLHDVFSGHIFKHLKRNNQEKGIDSFYLSFLKICGIVGLFLIFTYMVVRFANPYMFESISFFDPQPNSVFIQNIQSLKALDRNQFFPPAIQWFSTMPVFFVLKNIAFFGVGLPYFIVLVIGLVILILQLQKNIPLAFVIGWSSFYYLYQSVQFSKNMRYFIFLYPFFAIFAAVGIIYLKKFLQKNHTLKQYRYGFVSVFGLIIGVLLIWPLAFSHIYWQKHSRVEASEWIYQNIPNGSTIVSEHWDDGLPLGIENPDGRMYIRNELPVFGPDNEEKWNQMNELLQSADYYILSSNRAWGSISTVPDFYPKMGSFYKDLFNERTNFTKVKEFTSYPTISIFGLTWEIKDDWSEEAFTVYDHPKVMIYKKR